jgi:hypothetical protein
MFRYREDGKTYSFNALFVSFRSQQQSRYLHICAVNIHCVFVYYNSKHYIKLLPLLNSLCKKQLVHSQSENVENIYTY